MLQARSLLKKGGQEVPIELLNNIGVLHFERGEFEVCATLKGLDEKLQLVFFSIVLEWVYTHFFSLESKFIGATSNNNLDVFLFDSLLNNLSRRL